MAALRKNPAPHFVKRLKQSDAEDHMGLSLAAYWKEYLDSLVASTANTTKDYSIKVYILNALYNAPATIDHYYRAEVNHDLCGQ